ncbi:MAG: DUF72 domain-containing protein [Candidatus Malihini olakiniferum]
MIHNGFRFCFKFPAAISYQAALRRCDKDTHQFFRRLQPLGSSVGQFWL